MSAQHSPEFISIVEQGGAGSCPAQIEGGDLWLREDQVLPIRLDVFEVTGSPFAVMVMRHPEGLSTGVALSINEETARKIGAAMTDHANRLAARRENGGRA